MSGGLSSVNRCGFATMLIVVAQVATAVVHPLARMQEARTRTETCCGLTTDLIVLEQGQKARLEVTNTAGQGFPIGFHFVDAQGQVLANRETTVNPGKTEAADYLHPGGANRIELRAQIVSKEKRAIGLLRPVLRILDNSTGKIVRVIGPEQFKKR